MLAKFLKRYINTTIVIIIIIIINSSVVAAAAALSTDLMLMKRTGKLPHIRLMWYSAVR